ncbi:MAG: histidinol-phosphate aminotransferase family protein [Methanomassiliicoccales archaeon]|nr:histidinol-phosphate aminotransferase family protein [Methanomassiliicoccales archaeon]NYT14579.1 histidinol-phosphate aminotransferase family protein [Methanomassiliicoccales archaeon]
MDPSLIVRKEILSLQKPFHGGTAWKLGEIEDFSSNLNPLGPLPCLGELIAEYVQEVDHYPDDYSLEFREALSDHYKVPIDCVIAGAGSSELIRLFPEVFISPGDEVLIPKPGFSEYAFGCRLMGASIKNFHLIGNNDFRVNYDEILSKLDKGLKAVYLCNPNNPTGRLESKKKILELAEELEKRNALLFLDECLLELVEGSQNHTCAGEVESHSNMFIINSLTKSFGFPGLRVGYGIGSLGVIAQLEKARLSWNMGGIEQRVAASCVRDHYSHVTEASKIIDGEKRRMSEALKTMGMSTASVPDSFFFFSSLKDIGFTSVEFKDQMLKQGILVRDCTSFGNDCENYTRFSVRTREKNDVFLSAFKRVLES